MVYSNKLVVVLKNNGKILQYLNETLLLEFDCMWVEVAFSHFCFFILDAHLDVQNIICMSQKTYCSHIVFNRLWRFFHQLQ